MSAQTIPYVRAARGDEASGTPRDWFRYAVFDAATGEKLLRVVEANAEEGWFIRYRTGPDGRLLRDGDQIAAERVEMPIRIERSPEAA